MLKTAPENRRRREGAGLALLLLLLVGELAFSVRRETQTWDEACHIFAGYRSWKSGDFGINPEHPPLVKFAAALPLLSLPLRAPELHGGDAVAAEFLDGHDFLYSNDADKILFRARMAAAAFAVLLALLVFAAAREMFGAGPSFLALILMVFEPNVLAYGALVTTDMGLACCLFGAAYAFYRYVRRRTAGRLAVAGIAAGAAAAAKFSGLLVFPILGLLATHEVWAGRRESLRRAVLRQSGALAAIGAIAFVVVWGLYGLRYSARPDGLAMTPSLTEYADALPLPIERRAILALAHGHILPESYLYGLTDILQRDESTYLFGTLHPRRRWFDYSAAVAIKSSLALLVLLGAAIVFILLGGEDRRRELVFLAIPALLFAGAAPFSHFTNAVRFLLPIYPFLFVLAGWAAWKLLGRGRAWACGVAALLIFNGISSGRAFPTYIAYSNEAWGGPGETYKLLTDSNVDWGQQLMSVKRYLDGRGVHECWFAYTAALVADPAYYGIPCRPLTSFPSIWLQPWMDVPPTVDGTVLISAAALAGYKLGPGEANPYDQFRRLRPTAVIDDGILVFDGRFDIPLAAALNHVTRASLYERRGELDKALAEARTAAALAPASLPVQEELRSALMKNKRAR
jgi:4-amino-4-deoxy-L-arabinose transferase-like glycosyltransferase